MVLNIIRRILRNTYSFLCVAKDTADNVEDQEAIAEATTRVEVAQAIIGDFNEDGCVDRGDYDILMADVRGPEPHDPIHDLNEDGLVNRADARTLVGLFTNARGAACN